MTPSPSIPRRPDVFPDGPAGASRLLEPVLCDAAGPGAEAVSIALDLAAPVRPGDSVWVEAWVERAARTLVFVSARLTGGDGGLLANATAVFRRRETPPAAP